MTSLPLPLRIRDALASRGAHPVVLDAGGHWSMTGEQLLAAAAWLSEELGPLDGRPLVAWLRKSTLYYAFTAFALMNRRDFCPLDANNPVARVAAIAAELPGALVLCDSDAALAELRQHGGDCRKIEWSPRETGGRATGIAVPDREAIYYIATSGSTGRPKLVQVPHDRTIPFIDWAIPFYGIGVDSRWAQFSSIGFDLSLVDFLSVVCGGGCLISLSSEMDRIRPAKAVMRNAITHWHSVPSMIPYFLREKDGGGTGSSCRLFSFCGEPLMKADADALADRYPRSRIVNTYGPTEATLFCSFFDYVHGDESITGGSLPIGQPIPSWNFVLLPDDGALRLIVLSDNVSNGYVGAKSTLFSTISLFGRAMRAFDTGDYFRRAGPHLYFSHRKDGMVKVNGNRIDLGEIEAQATKAGLVNPVALVIGGAIMLAAEGAEGASATTLQELARYLPRASLPATLRMVPAHPRTLSGKLDRSAIREALVGDNASR